MSGPVGASVEMSDCQGCAVPLSGSEWCRARALKEKRRSGMKGTLGTRRARGRQRQRKQQSACLWASQQEHASTQKCPHSRARAKSAGDDSKTSVTECWVARPMWRWNIGGQMGGDHFARLIWRVGAAFWNRPNLEVLVVKSKKAKCPHMPRTPL